MELSLEQANQIAQQGWAKQKPKTIKGYGPPKKKSQPKAKKESTSRGDTRPPQVRFKVKGKLAVREVITNKKSGEMIERFKEGASAIWGCAQGYVELTPVNEDMQKIQDDRMRMLQAVKGDSVHSQTCRDCKCGLSH